MSIRHPGRAHFRSGFSMASSFRAKTKAPEPMPRWAKGSGAKAQAHTCCKKIKARIITALSLARAQGAGLGKIFTMDSAPQRLHLTGRSFTCVVGKRNSTVCCLHAGQRYRLFFVTILAHSFWFFNCLLLIFWDSPIIIHYPKTEIRYSVGFAPAGSPSCDRIVRSNYRTGFCL